MSEQDDDFNSFHTEGDPDMIRRWEGSGKDMRLVEIDTAEKMQGVAERIAVGEVAAGIGTEEERAKSREVLRQQLQTLADGGVLILEDVDTVYDTAGYIERLEKVIQAMRESGRAPTVLILDSMAEIGSEPRKDAVDIETGRLHWDVWPEFVVTEQTESPDPEPPKVKCRGVNKYKSSYGPPNRRR